MRRLSTFTIIIALIVLFIITFGTRFADNTSNLTSSKNQINSKIIVKVENGQVTNKQQIPIILNDNIHVSIEMKDVPEMTNLNYLYGSPDIKKNPTILQDETHSKTNITNMLEKARLKIKFDTFNYNFTHSGLQDFVMESGGQPLRSLVVSTWRSGSSFTGDLVMNARPGTFYQYEPLFKYGLKQFKTLQEGSEPLRIVKQMLKCNYEGLEDNFESEIIQYRKGEPSTRMWEYCKYENNVELCFNPDFTSQLCKLFPFQTMKVVRLRLKLVEKILDDKTLNVKVILLVRDPRGVMQSRLHRPNCKLSPNCWDPSMLCADMVSDYVAARTILQQYPDRLMVLRFEELALQINITSDRILNFLKVQRTQAFDEILQSHTNVEVAGAHSVFRVSRNVPYKWRTTLDFNNVKEIQTACSDAMSLWGYKMAHNETQMTTKDFNPVEDYFI